MRPLTSEMEKVLCLLLFCVLSSVIGERYPRTLVGEIDFSGNYWSWTKMRFSSPANESYSSSAYRRYRCAAAIGRRGNYAGIRVEGSILPGELCERKIKSYQHVWWFSSLKRSTSWSSHFFRTSGHQDQMTKTRTTCGIASQTVVVVVKSAPTH